MRFTTVSLVLLTTFAASSLAHASPLFDAAPALDSSSLTSEDTRITDELLSNRLTLDERAILYTPGEYEGFSNSFLGSKSTAGDISDRASGAYSLQRSDGTFDIPTIPEPPSLLLFGSGLLCIAGVVWRRVGRARRQGDGRA